jgi:hypothetical protein
LAKSLYGRLWNALNRLGSATREEIGKCLKTVVDDDDEEEEDVRVHKII